MAFEKKNTKMQEILKETVNSTSGPFETFERTKNFSFTLQPSVREKIGDIAKSKGYRSASSFLNEYFKKF